MIDSQSTPNDACLKRAASLLFAPWLAVLCLQPLVLVPYGLIKGLIAGPVDGRRHHPRTISIKNGTFARRPRRDGTVLIRHPKERPGRPRRRAEAPHRQRVLYWESWRGPFSPWHPRFLVSSDATTGSAPAQAGRESKCSPSSWSAWPHRPLTTP